MFQVICYTDTRLIAGVLSGAKQEFYYLPQRRSFSRRNFRCERIQQDRRLPVFPGVTSVSRDCGVRRQGRRILEGGHHTRPAPPNAPSQDSIRTSFGADWAAKGALPAERYRNFESKSASFVSCLSTKALLPREIGVAIQWNDHRSTFLSNGRSRFSVVCQVREEGRKRKHRHIYIYIYTQTHERRSTDCFTENGGLIGCTFPRVWIIEIEVRVHANWFFFVHFVFYTIHSIFHLRNVVLTRDWHLVNWNCSFSSFFFFSFWNYNRHWRIIGWF